MELRKLRISYLAEQFAQFILADYYGVPVNEVRHLTVEQDQAPHDLEHNNLRYDVKYSAPTTMDAVSRQRIWDFSIRGKAKGSCDYFVLVGSQRGVFSAVFLVPESEAPSKHLRIPVDGKSKWNAYKIWR